MYFLVELTRSNGTVAKAVWEHGTKDSAIMALYQTMASAIANPAVDLVTCIVIDINGDTQRYDHWQEHESE